jgi:hypothetical protein
MFDLIVESLVRELLLACPPDRDYRLADIKGDALPDPVSRYAADLMRAAARQELDSKRPRAFQCTEPDEETWSHYDRFASASVAHAVARADVWEDVLRDAARRALQHALQPRTGLVEIVFGEDGDEHLEQDEVVERIGGYHAGIPFRAAVVRAVKRMTAPRLNRPDFASTVHRVHDALTLDYTRSDWQKDLETLAVLLASSRTDSLPVDVAAIAADELGCADAGRVLRSMEVETVSFAEFTDLIAGPEPEPVEAEAPGEEPADTEEREPNTSAPIPLWQRFQRNLNEPIATAPRPAATRTTKPPLHPPSSETVVAREVQPEPAGEPESEESQRPLWQKYRSSQTVSPDESPATEIEEFILGSDGARIRDAFVDELFGGDQDSYLEVLDQLRRSKNWPEASRVIAENVFKRFQVNIYSDEAVAFTNAVEARFRIHEAGD